MGKDPNDRIQYFVRSRLKASMRLKPSNPHSRNGPYPPHGLLIPVFPALSNCGEAVSPTSIYNKSKMRTEPE